MRIYNDLSNRLEVDTEEPICNRAKLDTGTHCNYRCDFCYYKNQLNNITDFDKIKTQVDYIVACGLGEVDLSGGESSIHKNWFDILDYCKESNLKISTLSNGYKFADKKFIQKSKDHGLEEILFSVHGYDEISHNSLVGNKQGFKRIKQAIANAHQLDIRVRINCTVTHANYKNLSSQYVELMHELTPMQVNFLTLNYWGSANEQKQIDYSIITPHIHKSVDSLKGAIKNINIRYTPYCFMKGYEQYVCNYYQHIYDIYDWNIAVYDQKIKPEEYKKNKLRALYNSAKNNRSYSYYKKPECVNCKYYFICDGIENQIKEITVSPEIGDYITEVNYYRRGWYGA